MGPPDLKYEYFTIHTDSVSSTSWIDSSDSTTQHSYTNYLFRPLKDIVQVQILTANFDSLGSNVAYLNSPELLSQFNDAAGVYDNTENNFVKSDPGEKDRIRNSLAKFNTDSSVGRTKYIQSDYSTETEYITPIRKLDRITSELYDERGNPLDINNSNVFISYIFTCLKNNLGPHMVKKYRNI